VPQPATDESSILPAFSRRRLLAVLGVGAAAATAPLPLLSSTKAHAATIDATCAESDTDEQEVGPFYVAEGIVRSDITSGEDGIPLTFTVTLTDSDTCSPLVGAAVDVWHASAEGIYSDESSEGTVGDTYLRGIQITDSAGKVTFTSIYPGWYAGRTNHIHARIWTGGTASGSSYDFTNATLVHTGQMFFDEALNTAVAAVTPYSSNSVTRTTNSTDRVYTSQHGSEVLTTTTGNTTDGYASSVAYTVSGTGSTTTTSTDSSKLTLASSEDSVVYGKKLELSGRLLDSTASTGLASQTVTITITLPNGKKKTTKVKTNSTGHWSLSWTPIVSATYRASYAGASGHASATSAKLHVPVHYKVAVSDVSGTASHTHQIVAKGSVGLAGKGTKVVLHKIVDGKKHVITHMTTDAKGEWTIRWRMGVGKHHVDFTVPGTKYFSAGTSRTVTVHRT
jgi:protocatechuate 3,4-dioxygenase beta subunit